MSGIFDTETGWLTLTNVLLGLAVVVCLFAVGRAVFHDVLAHLAIRARLPVRHDDHAFTLESLGVTMADGGEPINEMEHPSIRKPTEDNDPPNIIRSDN